MSKTFDERFGNRIELHLAKDPLRPSEQEHLSARIRAAIVEVYTDLLSREPTEAEILGHEDIDEKIKRKILR